MKRSIRVNPDYPFADANLEATVREVDRFVTDPPLSGSERGEVLEFIRLIRQYAFLEKLIQGEVLCELPVHFNLRMSDAEDPLEQAERLAEEERSLLGLGFEPAEELPNALDDRGIKVFRRSHGPEPPEKLTGAFHFVGDLGPALLIGAAEICREAIFILAHEFGHLVMDVDPYDSRFCRWNRQDLGNVSDSMEESRADRFARALLLPAQTLRDCIETSEIWKAVGPNEQAVAKLAEVFDVAPAVLWQRLDDLGMERPPSPPDPPQADRKHVVDDHRPTDLPERFVNLALAAFGQRIFEREELARFLRIPPKRLDKFLAWCPIPRAPEAGPREDDLVEEE